MYEVIHVRSTVQPSFIGNCKSEGTKRIFSWANFHTDLSNRHPNGGSFVRTKKVEFGITVVQALHQRYGKSSENTDPDELYVVGKGKKTVVEMVGAESVEEQQRYNNNNNNTVFNTWIK